MNDTRFSMTLYISMPVLASACSIVMIAHFILLVEGHVQTDGSYGDAMAYIALAESFQFFNSDMLSFRIMGPLISGSIAGLFSLSDEESLGLLAGSLNFIYLLIGFAWMYYLAMKETSSNSLEVAMPTFLLLPLPAFWQGIFLPVPDALMFCTFGIILTGVLQQKLSILLPAMLLGVLISEWLLLSVLLLPLADRLRGYLWGGGYLAFAVVLLGYLVLPLLTQIPEAHVLYRPAEWFTVWQERFADRDFSFLRAFWRSFTLTLPFFAYRIYVTGWNRVTGTMAVWFGLLFVIAFILAPDSANRIVFMTMPALVLWQYRLPTFQMMDKPLKRGEESHLR